MWTYAAHQSTCRCRRLRAPSRWDGFWGMSSTCSPDFADRPCRSYSRQKIQENRLSVRIKWQSLLWCVRLLDLVDEISVSPCRVVRCGSRWTFPAPGPQPPSHGRRRKPCHRPGFHFLGPKRNQQTSVLVEENRHKQCQFLHQVVMTWNEVNWKGKWLLHH